MSDIEEAYKRALKEADFSNIYQAKTAWTLGWNAAVGVMTRKHDYWGAGDPDCPRDIKAANGELHTLRCKVCGLDSPKSFCRGTLATHREPNTQNTPQTKGGGDQ